MAYRSQDGPKLTNLIRVDLISLLVLLAALIIFAGEMIWGGKVPFFRDLNHYFYPLRYSLSTAFQASELPLWNRHMGMGFPLLADVQTGVLYPPHWLFHVLPLFGAVRAIYILHYVIAAIGAYFLWRHWAYPPYQAIVGAPDAWPTGAFSLGMSSSSLHRLRIQVQQT